MADSLRIYFPLDPLSDHEYDHASLRLDGRLAFNQDGFNQKPTEYDWMFPKSALTGAGFAVKPVGMPSADSELRIAGYLVDINIPACTVGNNLLLINGIPKAAELALLLLQHWLFSQGGAATACSPCDWPPPVSSPSPLPTCFSLVAKKKPRPYVGSSPCMQTVC